MNKIKVTKRLIRRKIANVKSAEVTAETKGKNKKNKKAKYNLLINTLNKDYNINKIPNYKNRLYAMREISRIIKNKFKKDKKLVETYFYIFDLDNDINHAFFKKSNKEKKYKSLVKKYKYTLNLNTSLSLNYFTIEDIQKEMDYYNSKIILIKGKTIKNIKDIHSLSKLKFFNLLLDIIIKTDGYYMRNTNKKNIKNLIKKYKIEDDLLFKSPNSLGTTELNYYTLISLYYTFLSENNENKESNDEDISDKKNYLSDKCDVNKIQEIIGEKIKFDDSKFVNNFNELKSKFGGNIDISKFEYDKSQDYDSIDKKIYLLRLYTEAFKQIVNFEIKEDNYIIKKCEFILITCCFEDTDQIKKIQNCLIEDGRNLSYEEEVLPKGWDIKEFCYSNYEFPIKFNNIFFGFSYRFKYPYILKRNTLMNNEEIYLSFIDYIKYVYKSPLMKDIFYNTPEFKEFLYPFEDEKILDELFENLIFLPLYSSDKLYGVTQKLIGKVYIAANIKSNNEIKLFKFEELINFFAILLVTILHEQFKHYLRMLIFFNSFIYNKNIELISNTNLEINDDNDGIFFSILSKNKNNYNYNNKINLPKLIDGGHKLEILLFGEILGNIRAGASLDVFNSSSWNKTISQHLEDFMQLNQPNKNINPKQTLSLENLKENKDIPQFLIKLLEQHCKINCIDNGIIEINNQFSSSRITGVTSKNIDDNNNIIIDTDYCTEIIRTKRDCDM